MNNLRKAGDQRTDYGRQRTDFCLLLSVICLLVLLTGCQFNGASKPIPNSFYINPRADFYTLGKVAILELYNNSSFPQVSTDVTDALFMALQKKQLFGLFMVRRDDPAWRGLQLDADLKYSLEQLSAMRRTLNCNAILIGTITQYEPYPHMLIGLRIKLVDLRDGEILWALEQVWDSADKSAESRIKDYFKTQLHSKFTSLNEQLITVSPIEFIKFVAYEAAETVKPKKTK
jgi:hypothetical protein